MTIKITEVRPGAPCEIVEIEGDLWTTLKRYGPESWETLMGSSWEDCAPAGIEELYQEYKKAQFDKLMAGVPIVGSLGDGNLAGLLDHEINNHSGNMLRSRPYEGQPWTTRGERGRTEIKGITMRDLRDCFIRAAFQSSGHLHPHLYEEAQKGENANLSETDMYGWDLDKVDPMAWAGNLICEVEKMMGIFPNIPKEN